MKWFTLSAAALVAFAVHARADKPGNRPYVQSGADGASTHAASRTRWPGRPAPPDLQCQAGSKDGLIETYHWYAE